MSDKVIELTKRFDKVKKDMGYSGCKNCKNQIEPLRTCEWDERGGDGRLHLICPKWERRTDERFNRQTGGD